MCLAGGQQARHDGVLRVAHHLRLPVRWDAAHVVVHRGQHRRGLLGDVDAGEDLGGLGDARQALRQGLGGQVVQVQVDVVLFANTISLRFSI